MSSDMNVNIFDARNQLSKLVRAAAAGEEVIIANRGEPMVRMVPAGESGNALAGAGQGRAILDWLEQHPLPAHAQRDAEEIEAGIEAERDAWD